MPSTAPLPPDATRARYETLPEVPESTAVHRQPPKSTPFEQTPTIAALQSRRPYYIPDTAAEERFPIVLDLLRANGVQSACILPLFTAQRELGGLHFGSLT